MSKYLVRNRWFEPTPKKTWWRDVEFDSKSEALQAITLSELHLPWEYHPKRFSILQWSDKEWVLDFAYKQFVDGRLTESLLEYKPGILNDTYLTKMAWRFNVLWHRNRSPIPSYVSCINAYERQQVPVIIEYVGNGQWHQHPGMAKSFAWIMWKHSRDRFDLDDKAQLKFPFESVLQCKFDLTLT